MTRRLRVRPQAHADLRDIAGQIAASNIDVALDFWDQVVATYRMLADHPGSGTRLEFNELPNLHIRRSVVSRYRIYVACYHVTDHGIEIIRLLHGSRERASIIRRELGL